MRLMHSLVRKHRLANDTPIAKTCGMFVRICLSTGMKPRSPTATPAFSPSIAFPFRASANRDQNHVIDLRLHRRLSPAKLTRMPSRAASADTVLVFSMTERKRPAFFFSETFTRSRSAPVISPSSISTTSICVPSVEYTVAISSPIMPPPITSMDFGRCESTSAPVNSTTRGSSGMNGNLIDCEPAAMIALSNFTTVRSPPLRGVTSR